MIPIIEKVNEVLAKDINRKFVKDLETNQWHSKRTIQQKISEIQQLFTEYHLTASDAIIIGLPNSYRFILFFLAALQAGITITSVNPQISKRELKALLKRNSYQAILLEDARSDIWQTDDDFLINFESIQLNYDFFRGHFLVQTNLVKDPQHNQLEQTSDALLMYTSGTTGEPKAVCITYAQLSAAVANICSSHRLSKADITYVCLPLFHINAQVISLLSTILSDGKLVIGNKFSASRFWQIIEDERITWVSVAPAILTILLKTAKEDQLINHKLRFVRSASAPLAPAIARAFEKQFKTNVIESYGMTEGASQLCINPLPPEQHLLGSVGKPYGIELKIVDEADNELAANLIGEIAVKGASIIRQYKNNVSAESFYNGWFYTGDSGYLNEAGYLFVVGRKRELINRGGEKISPYEVENVLLELEIIDSVAIIPVKDDVVGQRAAAFVVLHPNIETPLLEIKSKLNQYCHQELSSFKCPEFFFFVDELPVGPTGKVQRQKLIEKYLSEGVIAK